MDGKRFYAADFTETYSQAMMFIFCCMEKEPHLMKQFVAILNGGGFSGNKSIVDYLPAGTKKTIDRLDKEYVEHSLSR